MQGLKFKISVVASAFVISSSSFAAVNEADFINALKKVESTYSEDMKTIGYNLVIDGEYLNDTQNAQAARLGNKQIIKIFGGMTRSDNMSADGVILVACQVLGQTLGGAPIKGYGKNVFTSIGGADYFASVKCFKRVNRNDDNEKIVSSLKVPFRVRATCNEQFKEDANDAALCIRTSLAGIELANWLASTSRVPLPSTESHDPSKVEVTNLEFPEPQCRLDTFLAGALCKSQTFGDDPTKLNDGYCENDEVGARPLCWFKP